MESTASVNFCSDGHEQVSYLGDACPACEIARDFNKVVDELKQEIEALVERIGKD